MTLRRRRPADVHHRRARQDVASVYDPLGRKVETHLGSAAGALLTKSVYDTLAKGALTSSTRYVDGKAYAKAITGYDAAGLPKGESVTIPSVPGEEALAKHLHDDLRLQAGRQHRVGGTARARRPAGRDDRARLHRRRPGRHAHRRADLRHRHRVQRPRTRSPSSSWAPRAPGCGGRCSTRRAPAGSAEALTERETAAERRGQRPAVRLRPDRQRHPDHQPDHRRRRGQPVLRVRPPAAGHVGVDRGRRRLRRPRRRPPPSAGPRPTGTSTATTRPATGAARP